MSAAGPQAQPVSPGHSPYPGVVSPDAPSQGTASLRVLSTGYLGRRFASTVTFVRDGAALIVVNPGMVADIESILRPLRDLGVRPAAVTDVVLLAARPAHIVNAALFPGARLHDATAVYQNDTKARRPADRFLISPSVRLIETPGHHPDDLTLLVATARGIVAVTHLWKLPVGRRRSSHRAATRARCAGPRPGCWEWPAESCLPTGPPSAPARIPRCRRWRSPSSTRVRESRATRHPPPQTARPDPRTTGRERPAPCAVRRAGGAPTPTEAAAIALWPSRQYHPLRRSPCCSPISPGRVLPEGTVWRPPAVALAGGARCAGSAAGMTSAVARR